MTTDPAAASADPAARPSSAALAATILLASGLGILVLVGTPELARNLRLPLPADVAAGLALGIAGATLWTRDATGRAVRGGGLALGIAGVVLGGAGAILLYRAFGAWLPFSDEAPTVLGVAIAAACVLAVLRAASHGTSRASRTAALISGNSARALYLVVAIAGYFVVRPRLAGSVQHVDLIEYGLGLSIASFLLARWRAESAKRAPERPWASVATRHVAQVRPLPDRRWLDVDATVGAFVEQGQGRERYAQLLVASLEAARADETVVASVRERVDAYRDLPPPRFLATRKRLRRLAAANRERRLTLHREVVSTVGGGQRG